MNKKLMLSLLIGSLFVSSGARAAESWDDSSSSKVSGDEYWGETDNSSKNGVAEYSLSSIYADNVSKKVQSQETGVSIIRQEALKSAALAMGIQAGFAKQSQKINDQLLVNANYYDKIFDFGKLEIEDGLLPPVISEGVDSYNQPNENEVRASDKLYRIEFPAKIVNVPPNWREYLLIPFANADQPDKSILPTNKAEKNIWDDYVTRGWEEGVQQSIEVFDANRGRLKRDFEGMIRYKKLYEQGLVTKPEIARSELGVTGGGNEMAVGDRIIRMTEKAQLNPNSKKWMNKNPN